MSATTRWLARLPTSRRQLGLAVAATVLSFALIAGFEIGGPPGPARQIHFCQGVAGIVVSAVTFAYVIFLRVQGAPLVVTPSEVRLGDRAIARQPLVGRLLRWPHPLHDGAMLEVRAGSETLRIGVRRPPSLPLGLPPAGSPSVDVLLSPFDFGDVAEELGIGRLNWAQSPAPRRRDAIAPTIVWVATLAALAFGVSSIAVPVRATLAGRILTDTIVLGAVAAGTALTLTWRVGMAHTRLARETGTAGPVWFFPQHEDHGRLGFWRVASQYILLLLATIALTGVFVLGVAPAFLTERAFEKWIDTPACRQNCASHRLPFTSFSSNKSGNMCECGDLILRDTYSVGGGDSMGDLALDWFVRTGALVGGEAVWLVLLARLGYLVVKRRRRNRFDVSGATG